MFCGDAAQTDLIKTNEKNGILDFMRIMEQMNEQFSMIEFGVDDIVRSGLVRDYIITKLALGL
jgi:phosphate starvation-inducible protein PhoH